MEPPFALRLSVKARWPSPLQDGARRRDLEAEEYWEGLSKKQKTKERQWCMGSLRNQKTGDLESKLFQEIDAMHATLRLQGVTIPEPKFKTGQSVLQCWAPWFKGAEDCPATYNKKNRPEWYVAEIVSYRGWQTIPYAGQKSTCNTYNVF